MTIKDGESGLVLDDYTAYNDPEFERAKYWTQLCEDHAVHSSPSLQEMANDGMICGVEGCDNEAVYYYDIFKTEV